MMAHGKESCQCRRHEFNSWSRKIPRASEELSPYTTIIEPCSTAWGPQLLNPRSATTAAHDRRSCCGEKAVHRNERVRPALRNQSKACEAARTQHSPTQEKSLCKKSRSPLCVVPPHPVA
ncbi:unnamed protein product [Rangifer tarandus platyrhynchus]|uniref:Uncharacterized protein n=1 Tax=Rangifer tarandus platyrhynchus TaxID=3082113 RepID=A0AC60A275_RANTA